MRKNLFRKMTSILLAAVLICGGILPGISFTAGASTSVTVYDWDELVANYDVDGDKIIDIPSGTVVNVTGDLDVPWGEAYTLTGGGTLKRDNNASWNMIYVGGEAVLKLENVILDGANVSGNSIGGLVDVYDAELIMTGGSITRNAGYSSAVYVSYDGKFTMTGGSITRNTGYGGAVDVSYDGKFTMTGGSITENTGEYCGGVYVDGEFFVSGGAKVTGNTVGGKPFNVCLINNPVIITGALTGSIGITVDGSISPFVVAKPGPDELLGELYTITQSDFGRLSSDGGYPISLKDEGGLKFVEMKNPISISAAFATLEGLEKINEFEYYTIYNGQLQKPTKVNVELEDGTKLKEGIDYTWAISTKDDDLIGSSAGKNVGFVEIAITGKGNYTGRLMWWYRVDPKPIIVTSSKVKDMAYDPMLFPEVASVTFEGLVGSDKLVLYTDYVASAHILEPPTVGSNNAMMDFWLMSSQIAKNYIIDYENSSYETTFKVTSAKLTGFSSIAVFDGDADGTIGEGDMLIAVDNSNNDGTAVMAYQWFRNGVAIPELEGGTDSGYILTEADMGKSITVQITATGNYTGSLPKSEAVVVGKKPLGDGIMIDGPIGEIWTTGHELTFLTDFIDPSATYSIQWYRDGMAISGATTSAYTLAKADLGKSISVVITGTGDYTGVLSSVQNIDSGAPDPAVITATPGNGQVTLKWAKPFDGGTPIAHSELMVFEGIFDEASNYPLEIFKLDPSATSFTVTGLNNDQLYSFVIMMGNYTQVTKSDPVTATPKAGSPAIPGGSTGGGSEDTVTEGTVKPEVSINTETGVTSASVTDGEVSAAINNAKAAAGEGETSKVVIDIDAPESGKKVEATIPASAFNTIKNSDNTDLSINAGNLELTFSDAAVSGINATGDVKISAGVADTSNLTDAQKKRVGDRPVYDFGVTVGGSAVTKFNGAVTVSMPYTPKAGENLNAIIIYYVSADGKLECIPNCKYDPATGKVTFTTNHFSVYMVDHNVKTFSDTVSHWAKDSITFVAARELFSGTSANAFSPDAPMTRGMFATVLARLDGADLSGYKTSRFSDVPMGRYYSAAIEWAADKEIINGVGNGRFAPDTRITREQMATMLANYIKYKGINLSGGAGAEFADEANISSWAKDAVDMMQKSGIISGKPGNLFDPKGAARRGEVATIFARFVNSSL